MVNLPGDRSERSARAISAQNVGWVLPTTISFISRGLDVHGWLVLRRVAGKRLPQHSVERKWDSVGLHAQALSSDCPHLVDCGQRFGKMVALEGANG